MVEAGEETAREMLHSTVCENLWNKYEWTTRFKNYKIELFCDIYIYIYTYICL